jgi:hypothetical protein
VIVGSAANAGASGRATQFLTGDERLLVARGFEQGDVQRKLLQRSLHTLRPHRPVQLRDVGVVGQIGDGLFRIEGAIGPEEARGDFHRLPARPVAAVPFQVRNARVCSRWGQRSGRAAVVHAAADAPSDVAAARGGACDRQLIDLLPNSSPDRLHAYYAGSTRWEPVVAGQSGFELVRNGLLQPVIRGGSPLCRLSAYRPVTPDVAGSSPVAPTLESA